MVFHTADMSTQTVPVIDYSAIMREAAAQQHQMIEELTRPIWQGALHALGDAAVVTLLGLMLVAAVASLVIGFRSSVMHVFLPCAAVGALLLVLAAQALMAFPFTWASAGLGFVLIAVALATGGRFALRFLRLLDA